MKDNMPNYAVQFYDPEEAKMGRPRDESYIVVAVAADTATEVWFKRSIFDRVYVLLTDRPDWAEKISRSAVAHRAPCTHEP
jgi:hypothetical protein